MKRPTAEVIIATEFAIVAAAVDWAAVTPGMPPATVRGVFPAATDIRPRLAAGDGVLAGVAALEPVSAVGDVVATVPGVAADAPAAVAMLWSFFLASDRALDGRVEVDARGLPDVAGATAATDPCSAAAGRGPASEDRGPGLPVRAVRLVGVPSDSADPGPVDCGPGSESGLSAEATPTACGPANDKPSANAATPIRVPRLVIGPPLPKHLLAAAALAGSV